MWFCYGPRFWVCTLGVHLAYILLQYPLLFPYGEDGYLEANIPSSYGNGNRHVGNQKRISFCKFVSFRIQYRYIEEGVISNSHCLFQQFVVDSYSMIEFKRLSFIRQNQENISKEFLSSIKEVVNHDNINPTSISSRVVLSFSFLEDNGTCSIIVKMRCLYALNFDIQICS